MDQKLGAVTHWGGKAESPSNNVARAEAYLHPKFHIDSSSRLATVHQRFGEDRTDKQTDRQTGQRSDNIGRTVLQTVAQKRNKVVPAMITR